MASVDEQIDQAIKQIETETDDVVEDVSPVHMKTNNRKLWMIALVAGIVFALLSLPQVYTYTNQLFGNLLTNGCPNLMGIGLHAIVAVIVVRLIMTCMKI